MHVIPHPFNVHFLVFCYDLHVLKLQIWIMVKAFYIFYFITLIIWHFYQANGIGKILIEKAYGGDG